MFHIYNKVVKAVGELILSGIWYSDACEIVFKVMGLEKWRPLPESWWERFEMDVNSYTDREVHLSKRKISMPKYKCIF